jgi:hypothetical protein
MTMQLHPIWPTARTRRTAGLLAAGTLVTALATGTASAASPAPSPATRDAAHRYCAEQWTAAIADRTVATLRALGDCEVDRRLATLETLDTRVADSRVFTDRHKDQLRNANDMNPASYETERTGLRALRSKIDAETDLAALRGLIGDIAQDFRVYLLVVPKTHLVGGGDAVDKASDHFDQLAQRLAAAIDKADAAGKDVAEARRLLDDLKAKVRQADAEASPVAARIMPLSPDDWNSGKAGPVLAAARDSLRDARDLLRASRADARQIIEILKA